VQITKVEKVVSGFSHLLCKIAGNFFPHAISICENHDNAEGSTAICLHGKTRLDRFLTMSNPNISLFM